jgi:DNA-binding CsgD family transcriptional regulator
VSEAADPTIALPVPERKRMLVEGVVRLVGADTWIWSTAVADPSGSAMSTCVVHGGWISEDEPGRVFGILTDPRWNAVLRRLHQAAIERQHATVDLLSLKSDPEMQQLETAWNRIGFGPSLMSTYTFGSRSFSGIGLHRRLGKPDFTDRDRAIVHLIFNQVDWLHRHGTDVPAKDKVLQLSPRERQVMIFLLGGDSPKQVAQKLELSEHTVGDYVKHIYKRFSVSSRAELLAHFIAGGQH